MISAIESDDSSTAKMICDTAAAVMTRPVAVAICIEIDRFCISNDGFCISNDGFNKISRWPRGAWRVVPMDAGVQCAVLEPHRRPARMQARDNVRA